MAWIKHKASLIKLVHAQHRFYLSGLEIRITMRLIYFIWILSKWTHSSKTIKRLPTVNNVLWWIIYLIGYCQQHNVNKTIHKDCTRFCLPHTTQQETFKILFIYQIAMLLPVERIFIPFLLHQYLSSLFTCLLTQFQLLKTFNKSLIYNTLELNNLLTTTTTCNIYYPRWLSVSLLHIELKSYKLECITYLSTLKSFTLPLYCRPLPKQTII